MQGKHSRTPGNWPNLLPGEFGVNLADKRFFMRAGGKKIAVDMETVGDVVAPAGGTLGAPLRSDGSGVYLDDSLLPLGVLDGKVHVDPQPRISEHVIPGVVIQGVSDEPDYMLAAESLLIEPFYVASEDFKLTRQAMFITEQPTGGIKFGIATVDGVAILSRDVGLPPQGFFSMDWANEPLSVGWYYAYIWTEDDLHLRQMQTYRPNQPFDLTTETPAFVQRRFGAPGAYRFTALPPIDIVSTEVGPIPGEPRIFAYQWVFL